MPVLFLIRHGENDYLKHGRLPGHTAGIHLNERGRAQAEALAQSLGKLPIKAVYSSPLERAVETAEPLAGSLKLEVQLRGGLTDTDVGAWAGKEIRNLNKNPLWKVVQGAPARARFPEGESFLENQTRIVQEIETICTDHRHDLVAVVFHSDPLKLAVAHYLGLPLDHFQRLTVDPGSVTVMAIGELGARLIALNLKPPFEFNIPKRK